LCVYCNSADPSGRKDTKTNNHDDRSKLVSEQQGKLKNEGGEEDTAKHAKAVQGDGTDGRDGRHGGDGKDGGDGRDGKDGFGDSSLAGCGEGKDGDQGDGDGKNKNALGDGDDKNTTDDADNKKKRSRAGPLVPDIVTGKTL